VTDAAPLRFNDYHWEKRRRRLHAMTARPFGCDPARSGSPASLPEGPVVSALAILITGGVIGSLLTYVVTIRVWRVQEVRELRSQIVNELIPPIRDGTARQRIAAVAALNRLSPQLPQADRRLAEPVERSALALEEALDLGDRATVDAEANLLKTSLDHYEAHTRRALARWW
jgi:hypothetical protein